MRIIWQDTDITGYVIVRRAIARDTCGERCDGLDIEFENAESWYRWGPKEDDEIRISQDGWDSGILYLNTIAPGDGKYRVIATALPCAARKKEWRSYEEKSIETILRQCGAVTGMEYRIYGIDAGAIIPYIQQENESAAAFLHRLGKLEGAKLKCVNGRYTLIGLDWAQDRKAIQTLSIGAEQRGIDYRRSGVKDRGLTLVTPYATGSATDESVDKSHTRATVTEYPATDNIQAARWARNLLKEKNRKCESVTIQSSFHPAWSAMTRIDITGNTDAAGEWLIEEAEHDLINLNSRAVMHRCNESIM